MARVMCVGCVCEKAKGGFDEENFIYCESYKDSSSRTSCLHAACLYSRRVECLLEYYEMDVESGETPFATLPFDIRQRPRHNDV
jgi:hypothetical protein